MSHSPYVLLVSRARSAALVLALAAVGSGCADGRSATPKTPSSAVPASVVEGTTSSADGVRLHYRTAGRGEPTVVLVHCWGCDSDEWNGVLPSLAANHRVVALDLAGHGRSGKGRTAWTVPSFAGDVRAVMDHVGINKAILVGHSMAGTIVVETAVEIPDRIAGVITMDTLLDVATPNDPKQLTRLFDGMRADFAKATEELVRILAGKNAESALVQRIVTAALANDPAIAIPVLENNLRFPVREAFRKVKVPIISINSDLVPTNVEGNRALAPQYEARILPGVGHWPMLEAPQRFEPMVADAVADIARTAN